MTAAPGFWGQSMGRFRRLRGARAGLTWIGTLLLCAAAAPWVAAGHPVLVVGPDGWRCPVLEAFHQADFLWSGLFLALLACGSLRRLSRPRLGALVGLTLLVTSAVLGAGAEPANLKVEDWDQVASREDTTLLWPLIRHGATDIDKGAVLVGVGAPGHVLGTDVAGRDVAARLLYGARTSLLVGLLAASVATGLGLLIGSMAGWYRGLMDGVLSWVIQVVACFPVIVLVITVCAFVQPSLWVVMLLIGVTGWTDTARLVRGEVLRLRALPFVEGARAVGVPEGRILVRHVLPHTTGPMAVQAALAVAAAVLIEATLAFLGLGPADTPSWGRLLQEGRDALPGGAHLVVLPGLLVFLTVCAWNLVADGLRDATDPFEEGAA